MSYVALYRAYRPQTFDEVAGQKPIIQTLRNAIKLNKVAHAYLFAGPRGTGKTTMAKIMAKALNCENGPDDNFDNNSEICQGISKGSISDVIEIDAASNNGVDEIRELRDNVKYLPSVCRYKVYIIDEVHMLSQGAFNALLKTLEEPPAHVVFILATTEPHKVPATILSRCQRFDFQAISETDIIQRLKIVAKDENIDITDEALELVASLCEGGMRDALSLLDEAVSYAAGKVDEAQVLAVSGNVSDELILDLLVKIINGNSAEALDSLNKILNEGKEISKVISDIMTFLRNILLFKINKIASSKRIYSSAEFISFANSISSYRIYNYLNLLNDTLNNIKFTNQKRAFLEICILKMSDKDNIDIQALLRRIDRLENTLEQVKNMKSIQSDNSFTFDEPLDIPSYEEINNKVDSFDYTNCVKSSDLNPIINGGIKSLKNELSQKLENIKIELPILSNAKVVCVSQTDAIFTLPTEGTCNRAMKDPNYSNILKELNKDYKFEHIYFINSSMWDEVIADFAQKFKAGDKQPVLDEHKIRIFKYVKPVEDKVIDPIEDFLDN